VQVEKEFLLNSENQVKDRKLTSEMALKTGYSKWEGGTFMSTKEILLV